MEHPAHPSMSPGSTQYRFLRRIATGGMAELFLGEASGVGGVTKRVALKRMLPSHAQDEEYLQMFLEEARLASSLQHPNIVQTYDVLEARGEYIIVMEFLEGADLQQIRRLAQGRHVPITLEHILDIARGVLTGLHYAHHRTHTDGQQMGIVHRDVSPQNVFLTYDGGVKLLDFGIAKTDQSVAGTSSGVLKGKVLYMAPEQCGGGRIDQRTDLYSVGVLLYQLITDTVPHRGKNAYDTMRSIIDDPAPSPRLISPSISPDLEAILLRALEKRPEDRFPSARDMLAAVEAFSQRQGLHMSTVGLSNLVEEVLGPHGGTMAPSEGIEADLPPPIEIGAGPEGPVQTGPPPTSPVPGASAPSRPASASSAGTPLLETDHATVRRVHGVTLVHLFGVLDEQFDHARVVPHLKGEVLLDTGDVTRITSFGIRSLLHLFSETRAEVGHLWHVRSSVAFVNQVSMIRSLLAGGRIISFQAPFIDRGSGANFTVLLQGDEGLQAVRDHVLPKVPSPSDPSLPAEFDDDPEAFLSFVSDYVAEAPNHLLPALRALEDQGRRRDVELIVRDDHTLMLVRRPIRSDARWKRLMSGLEGRVRLDLVESPSATEAGTASLVEALDGVAHQLLTVELLGAPVAMAELVAMRPRLQPIVGVLSVQVETRCEGCQTARRMAVDTARLREPGPVTVASACGRCGGNLVVTSSLPDPSTLVPTAPVTAAPAGAWLQPRAQGPLRGCLRQAGVAVLLLVGAVAALVQTAATWGR